MPAHNPLLNPAVRGLGKSATLAINERSNELIKAGKKIYKFGLGQSPFPVPQTVVEALKDSAHEKDYLEVAGLKKLRGAIAEFYRRRYQLDFDENDVLIGPGSKELLFVLQLVLNSELLIPRPSWVSYEPQARIVGKKIHWLKTSSNQRWLIEPEEIERFCKSDSSAKVIILNYPSNPTGQTFSKAQLEILAETLRKNDVIAISDEIYGELTFSGKHHSLAAFYPEGTIISSGLSKWCGAGGWRLGCFAFPKQLAWLNEAMAAVASETFTSVSAPIQYAAVKAFTESVEIEDYLAKARTILKAIGDFITDRLSSAGIALHPPQGGFYIYLDFSPKRRLLLKQNIDDDLKLCEALLEQSGVAVLPGSAFGQDPKDLNVRLAFVNFDGEQALKAVSEPIDQAFLACYCPDVIEGIEKLARWGQTPDPV